jgi:hypothetical protein
MGAITVAARSVFARSNDAIVGSSPTQGIDVCVRLFYLCVVLCVGSGLARVQRVLPSMYRLKKLKSCEGQTKGCRAIGYGLKPYLPRHVCDNMKVSAKIASLQ